MNSIIKKLDIIKNFLDLLKVKLPVPIFHEVVRLVGVAINNDVMFSGNFIKKNKLF
jgi:hypothetical protein